jgi:L-fuculose-phosphate aldolase
MRHIPERQAVVAAMAELGRLGLNQGASGNVGRRVADGVLVTPSGVAFDRLGPGDVVELGPGGAVREGRLRPSSEWRFHRDLLDARREMGAVVHVHSPHATALACLRQPIPAFHYMVALAGGRDIRVADYATFGTQALSDQALQALEGRKACLLANHGMIALGADLTEAVSLAREVENLAQQYLLARQAGEPVCLDDQEMARVLEKFRDYGPATSA